MARDKLQQPTSDITGAIGNLLNRWWEVLNAEPHISRFSGANPNTSGFTGLPGDILVNVGSASTHTRIWQMGGASRSTNSWFPLRIA